MTRSPMRLDKRCLSRRRFLKGAAAGAAAVAAAAPAIVPASALGLPPDTPAPSNRLAMGFIGVGGQGTHDMLNLLGQKEVQGVVVCDCDKKQQVKAKEALEKRVTEERRKKDPKAPEFKGCEVADDFRAVVERKDLDAVMIATPDHWHAFVAVAAAKAGKDIYCEKPLTLTIREARVLADTVRRYGRVFQTGSQQRSHGPFRYACELVRSAYIGKVTDIYVRVWGTSRECDLPGQPVPEGLDWDLWLGPAPWRPFNRSLIYGGFRPWRDYSGGGVTDWGAHHFDIAQWAMNMDNSGPVEVYPPDERDHPCLMFRYADGTRMWHLNGGPGEKALNARVPEPFHRQEGNIVYFQGEKGWIEVSRGHIRSGPSVIATSPVLPGDVHLYRSPGHFADFVRCCFTRDRPICDVEIGTRSVTVCHLANICYWLNRPLKWDPVAERITNDAEADRWTDRVKRAPWIL